MPLGRQRRPVRSTRGEFLASRVRQKPNSMDKIGSLIEPSVCVLFGAGFDLLGRVCFRRNFC